MRRQVLLFLSSGSHSSGARAAPDQPGFRRAGSGQALSNLRRRGVDRGPKRAHQGLLHRDSGLRPGFLLDAQADPVVRIEAGRVRRALEHYYLTTGRQEIVTTIPKGGYTPHFQIRNMKREAAKRATRRKSFPRQLQESAAIVRSLPRWTVTALAALLGVATLLAIALLVSTLAIRNEISGDPIAGQSRSADVPKILVRQFRDLTETPASAIIAKGLTEEVLGRLAKFKDLIVVAAPQQSDLQALPSERQERYVLEGSVRLEKEKLRLTAKVVSDGAIVWANIYDDDLDVRAMLVIENEIASRVAAAIARPYGVASGRSSTRVAPSAPNVLGAYNVHRCITPIGWISTPR